MFNERVLEFEGGAFIPCRKGAQLKNRTKINKRRRFGRCMVAVAAGHCDKCTQRTHSASHGMQPRRSLRNSAEAGSSQTMATLWSRALVKPGASAYLGLS
jgi:hypothetical protein